MKNVYFVMFSKATKEIFSIIDVFAKRLKVIKKSKIKRDNRNFSRINLHKGAEHKEKLDYFKISQSFGEKSDIKCFSFFPQRRNLFSSASRELLSRFFKNVFFPIGHCPVACNVYFTYRSDINRLTP